MEQLKRARCRVCNPGQFEYTAFQLCSIALQSTSLQRHYSVDDIQLWISGRGICPKLFDFFSRKFVPTTTDLSN